MRLPSLLLALLLPAGLSLSCRHPEPPPREAIRVEVSSTPAQAAIFLGGKRLGETPQVLSLASGEDLLKLTATHADETVVEKRIRFLAADRAEVRFVFGGDRPAMAKALGLARILVFDYGAAVTFEVDRYELRPEFMQLLDRQAEMLKAHFPDTAVMVCGHTDSMGSAEHNLALSLNRARAVADDLAGRGVARERLKVQGFGSTYPVADNGSEDGRAQNRRTEVVLPLED